MRRMIFWTLIVLGPQPYVIDTYPSLRACTQAKYNFGGMGDTHRHRAMTCKPAPQLDRDIDDDHPNYRAPAR